MDPLYSNIVWALDLVLAAAAAVLCIGGLAATMAMEKIDRRRGRDEEVLSARLRDCEKADRDTIRQCLSGVSETLDVTQWIRLINRHEALVPEAVWPVMEEWLRASPVAARIESLAGSARDKWRRIDAMKCIGILNLPSSVAILERGLAEKDEDICYFAMLALGTVRTPESERVLLAFLKRHVFSGQRIMALIENFPPAHLPSLLGELDAGDALTRFWLLKLMAKSSVVKTHRELERYTRDPSPDVRAAACECLGASGDAESRDTLLRCMGDEVWYVRLQAVRAVSALFGTACLPQMIERAAAESSPVVQEALRVALLRDPDAVLPLVEGFLDREDRSVKVWCMNALVDSNNVIRLLVKCLSPQEEESGPAIRLLGKLIRSGLHFGLKENLDRFQAAARVRLLGFVAAVEPGLADRLGAGLRKGV